MSASPTVWAVVPAAGVGRRMAPVGADRPKQYLPLAGSTVIQHSLQRLLGLQAIATVVVAVHPHDRHWNSLSLRSNPRIETVLGGAERHESVLAALALLSDRAKNDDWVLVHDAVRPCVTRACIHRLIEQVQDHPAGGLLAYPLADTLKRADEHGQVITTVDRTGMWTAATPQMFRFSLLSKALQESSEAGLPTDEAMAIEQIGFRPQLVEGRRDNIKITVPGDLQLAELILQAQARELAGNEDQQ